MARNQGRSRTARLIVLWDGGLGVFRAGRSGKQPDSSEPGTGGTAGSPAPDSGEPGDQGDQAGGTDMASAPARKSGGPASRIVVVAVAVAAVAAAGTAYAVSQSPRSRQPATARQAAAAPSGPMLVTSITPATASTGVDGASPIAISFSDPVAAHSPRPQIQPSVPGTWRTEGYSMVFTPSVPFGQSTRVTVEIPGGRTGIRSAGGVALSAPMAAHFTTGRYPQLALAELLAEQGYLPMTFEATTAGATSTASAQTSADPASSTPAGQAYSPPAGTFNWEPGYPSMLQSMWTPYSPNVILRGAVMAFESQHNMTVDGNVTNRLWNALFRAQQNGDRNQNGYTYAVADQRLPETLTIYHDGHVVLRSLTNTGIPVSPTVNGTFPVYERLRYQIMSGTNPDGSHYADPVSFVSYFNGGDAVHYFPRAGYGYQQSLGCVELPYTAAERAYPYLTYGSLVTVMG